MHRKGVKQIIYGFFLLIIISLFAWLFYLAFLQPAPTCSDGKRNQDETEVDCGGPNCSECELKRVQAIRVFSPLTLPSPDGKRSTLLIQFQNPNASYGVYPLSYTVTVYGHDGGVIYKNAVDTFVYPSEITYRLEPNIPVASNVIERSEIAITRQEWVRRSEFSAPQMQVRDVRVERDGAAPQVAVTGVLKNDNAFIVSRAVVGVIVGGDGGSLVGASRTLIESLQPLEERYFSVMVPVAGVSEGEVLEPKVFIEAKR